MISQNNISKAELFNFDTNHKIENIKNLQNQYHKYSGYLNGFIVIMGVFIKFVVIIFDVAMYTVDSFCDWQKSAQSGHVE